MINTYAAGSATAAIAKTLSFVRVRAFPRFNTDMPAINPNIGAITQINTPNDEAIHNNGPNEKYITGKKLSAAAICGNPIIDLFSRAPIGELSCASLALLS
jgi:hypothetical protein